MKIKLTFLSVLVYTTYKLLDNKSYSDLLKFSQKGNLKYVHLIPILDNLTTSYLLKTK